jgi:hypothetical protein
VLWPLCGLTIANRSTTVYTMACICCFGIFAAGKTAVQGAVLDDVFDGQPVLRAKVVAHPRASLSFSSHLH